MGAVNKQLSKPSIQVEEMPPLSPPLSPLPLSEDAEYPNFGTDVQSATIQGSTDEEFRGIVPGSVGPSPYSIDDILVVKTTRLLVTGAGLADVNGVYRPEWAQVPRHPVQPRWAKESGKTRCTITFARKTKTKKQATWCLSYGTIRVYQSTARNTRELPTAWILSDTISPTKEVCQALGEAPRIADVTGFRKLCAEVGPLAAVISELKTFAQEESRASSLKAGESSTGKVSVEHEFDDDDEVFEVGNWVILCPDEERIREEMASAGCDWDSRLLGMLGGSHEVADVVDDSTLKIVCNEGDKSPIELPEILVDMDYSNMSQFYDKYPIFICVQTTVCFLLWLGFALRDAGKNGVPLVKTLGGLDSIWPGQTSILLTNDCEDFRPQIWRWWSYQFSHVGLSHIGTNVAVNLLLGFQLERFHGTLKMFCMYEFGVLGGTLCWFFADCHTPVVGTSGGCFSLIGIRLGDLMMNWAERPMRYVRLAFLTGVILVNFAMEMAHEQEGGATTSNAAHIGGGLAGLVIGIIFGRNLRASVCENIFKFIVCIVSFILVVICLANGLQWPPQGVFEDAPWCWQRKVSNATIFGNWDWQCVRCHSSHCIGDWSQQARILAVSDAECAGTFAYVET